MQKFLCLIILVVLSGEVRAVVIRGMVKDALTAVAVESVLVEAKGTSTRTYTDSHGAFVLNLGAASLANPLVDRSASLGKIRVYGVNGSWISTFQPVKSEEHTTVLPSGAYLFVPDPDSPSRLSHPSGTLGKTGVAITLACSHSYYTAKELSASEGDTGLAISMSMWFPDAGNTGVPAGTVLKDSGPIRVDKNGTIVENMNVDGDIDVYADNVIVRNCKVKVTNGYWGIQTRSTGSTVSNCEINGTAGSGSGQGVRGLKEVDVSRCNIYGFSDGVMTDVGRIEDNYIHDLKGGPTSHHDGIQNGGGGPCIIRHNTILNPNGETSAIALFQDFDVPHDVLTEFNLLAGGGYTVYGGTGDKGATSNIRFLNNRFSTRYFPKSGFYGPAAYVSTTGTGNAWSGNVWFETGAVLNP